MPSARWRAAGRPSRSHRSRPERRRAAGGSRQGPVDQLGRAGAAALVDLHRHQPRRELDDVRGQPEQPQRAAASSPSSPPPITDPGRECARPAALRPPRSVSRPGRQACGRRSSPAASRPGTGGTNGYEPVASTSASYPSGSPSEVTTILPARSRDAALTPSPGQRVGAPDSRWQPAAMTSRSARRRRSTTRARPGRRRGAVPPTARSPGTARRRRAPSAPRRTGARPCRARRRQREKSWATSARAFIAALAPSLWFGSVSASQAAIVSRSSPQVPQPVAARVADDSAARPHAPPYQASRSCPLVTMLQRHTTA